MKWIQDNPFLSGLAAVTLVGIGALMFLLFQEKALYEETSDSYVASVQNLQALQNRSPFPNVENLAKTTALAEEFQTELKNLRAQLAAMEAPLNPDVTPQQFQDDLRERVNQVTAKAAEAGVALPEGFYLGFDRYSNTQPDARAAPALARELFVIDKLVNRLVDYKIRALDALTRRDLPEEVAPTENATQPVVQRYVIDLTFTAEQSKFRVAFNSLLNADEFLIVRALNVRNSSPAGPPIAAPTVSQAALSTGAAAALADSGAKTQEGLAVILGQELVTVTLQLEILDFAEPEASEADPEASQK